jgi:hypothetical protein
MTENDKEDTPPEPGTHGETESGGPGGDEDAAGTNEQDADENDD